MIQHRSCLGAGKPRNRRGLMIVWFAAALVILVSFLTLAVDVGYMSMVRSQVQTAADASALAAARVLGETGSTTAADAAAVQYGQLNEAGGDPVTIDANTDIEYGQSTYDSGTQKWTFVADSQPYNSVRIQPTASRGLFFGRVMGNNLFGTQASATATFLPRDIVVVTDLSGSMCHDSSIKRETAFPINIQDIWVALGSPTHGTMTDFNTLQYIDDSTSNVLAALNLDVTPYPHPEGSWSEYVNYVQTRSHIISEGYQHQYGLKTFVDFLLIERRYKSSTPALSDTPEQPMSAVKGAVSEMMTYLSGLQAQDKVGLVSYDSVGYVEQDLNTDTTLVTSRMNYLQAGAWGSGTNIGAGIQQGAAVVTGASSRPDARKIMLVLTDGLANASSSALSPADYAREQAQLAADQGITIYTVSFTDFADETLMQEIADIGGGVHFHVTGYTPAEYTEALEDVFVAIAAMLPLGLTN